MALPAISRVDCIVIEGVDARRFAQAQLSGDVDTLAPGHWHWNAWLNAKGRVQALMHLADPGDGKLLAVMRGGDAAAIRASLARYLLRMHANLTVRTFTGHPDRPAPHGTVGMVAGQITLGYGSRSLRLDSTAEEPDPEARDDWRLADIRQGWPSLPDGEATFLPPSLGLERLGAVAFGKGCYPGQEIVARLHYLGRGKYGLCHLQGPATLPLGEARNADGAVAGWILDAVATQGSSEALAVVPINTSREINIMGYIYTINMRFDS